MEYGKDYFGFVYIWHDTIHSKYIIGSHLGSVDDGYTTSTGGEWVRRVFKKRRTTMKRRILEYCTKDTVEELQKIEQKWLDLRPNIATNPKYYNQKQWARGGIDVSVHRYKPDYWVENHKKRQKRLVEQGKPNFNSENTSKWAKKRLREGSHHFLTSDFNKKPFEIYLNGKLLGRFTSKVEAVDKGIKASVIAKLRKNGTHEFKTGSRKKYCTEELYLFKKNDILEYKKL